MNKELLFKIAAKIRATPEHFNMACFIHRDMFEENPVCCIAGWASILEDENIEDMTIGIDSGAKALKMPRHEARRLFYVPGWPSKYKAIYDSCSNLIGEEKIKKRAEIAAQLLEDLANRKIYIEDFSFP